MSRHLHRHLLAVPLLLGSLMALSGVPAAAQTSALTYTGGGTIGSILSFTLGWQFSLASPVTITSLGIWDQESDGLGDAHNVSIWSNTGTLLLQSNVPSGTAGTLVSGFRFSSGVTIVSGTATLPAGTYVIGASYLTTNDSFVDSVPAVNATTASGVTYLQNRVATSVDTFPTMNIGPSERGYFGANFRFTTAVNGPEPATFALLALGTLTAGIVAKRRKA